MADKLMYIPNDDTQKYPFCRLELNYLSTQLKKLTNQNFKKVPKVVRLTNMKTLGTSVINSPLSPLSLKNCPSRDLKG